jgi:hypothetical protein
MSNRFEGYLKPNIVIHEVLYPLFLYVINPKSAVFSKHISSDVMNNLINGLLIYEINKKSLLVVLLQISSHVISDVVNELNTNFGQEKSPNRAMFEAAFNTLISVYSYTVEDIIITFGPIIKNFNVYVYINKGVFRTFSNLAPEEYANNKPNTPANKPNTPANKTNKHARNRANKSNARTYKKLNRNRVNNSANSEMHMDNKGLAISILSDKDNYLSKMVKDDKAKYLPLLFDMVDVV